MKVYVSWLSVIVAIASLVIVFRAIYFIKAIIPHLRSSVEEKADCTEPYLDLRWLVSGIVLLFFIPFQFYLETINLPFPNGKYEVECEYRLKGFIDGYNGETGENGTEIDERGKGIFHITVDYSSEVNETPNGQAYVEEYNYVYVESVTLPEKGDKTICIGQDTDDVECESSCEVELDGNAYTLDYEIGLLTDERLNWTLEKKFASVDMLRKIQFGIMWGCDIVSIASYFIAMEYKNEVEKRKQYY